SKEDGYDSMRFINIVQCKGLIEYLNDLTERGLSPTVNMVHNFSAGIAGKQTGKHCRTRWLVANKDEL
ncbi:hypothetical protein K432DRAFT_265491, partial [Lepidopterella palustris CBS 459.81]